MAGLIAASQGKSVLKGALIGAAVGGLVGLGAGAAAGVLLTGSATASTAAVMAGGSALKTDAFHSFPNIVDNYAGLATQTNLGNGTLYQLQGSLTTNSETIGQAVKNNLGWIEHEVKTIIYLESLNKKS